MFPTCFFAPLCHITPTENRYTWALICAHLLLSRTEAATVIADEVLMLCFSPDSIFFFDSLLIVAACKHSCKTGAFSFSSAAHLVSEKEIKSSGELRLKREGFLMLHKLWHSFSISPRTFLKISLLNPGCAHTAFAA